MECDSTHLVSQLVSGGMGITLWPEYSWGKRADVHLMGIRETGFYRSIFLLQQRSSETAPIVRKFAEYVENYMKQLKSGG